MIKPKKLTCIFAHPDDEAFGPGGSIIHFAKQCEVDIICVTDGGAGQSGDPKMVNNLSEMRKEEMRRSAMILGVKEVTFLDFPDGSLNNNNYHQVAGAIKQILDKNTPDALLTFNTDGVSGHLDHIAVAMITTYLFEKTPYTKNLLYYCEKCEIKDIIKDSYFVYFPRGIKSEEADLIIDVSLYHEQQVRAMREHVSQKADCDWILREFGSYLNTEYFRILKK